MEKARDFLQPRQEESDAVSRLNSVPSIRPGDNSSFYEYFILRGIRVERVQPGFVSCSFKVPSRLADRTGKLANGAIANLVDEVGGAVVHVEGLPMNVSVDMSISFLSTAHVDDELEITSRLLGRKGGYSGTIVLLKNKATGELIAEEFECPTCSCRHATNYKPVLKAENTASIMVQLNVTCYHIRSSVCLCYVSRSIYLGRVPPSPSMSLNVMIIVVLNIGTIYVVKILY